MSCFRAWEDTAIFSSDFLIKLQNVFLGLDKEKRAADAARAAAAAAAKADDDFDGIPIDADLDGEEIFPEEEENFSIKFKPSKWETIDPEVVESQAITSRWENLDKAAAIYTDDDIDGKPLDDEEDYLQTTGKNRDAGRAAGASFASSSSTLRELPSTSTIASITPTSTSTSSCSSLSASLSREVLREVELKVIQYQDDREVDRRGGRLKVNDEEMTKMVEKFREDLLKRATTASGGGGEQRGGSSSTSRRSRSRSRSPRPRHSSTSSSSASHHHSYKARYSSPSRRSRSRSPPSKRWK